MECNLGQGDLLRLEGGPNGIVIRCLRGTLWITKGDGADYLVYRGFSYDLKKGETAIVEALGTAEMRLETAACKGTTMRPLLVQQNCRA